MHHKANMQVLKEDLLKWCNEFVTEDTSMKTADEMYREFQTVMNSVINSHISTKIITKRNHTPWTNKLKHDCTKREKR